ncbi:DUF2157 domain-containing protein [Phenylobacterium sp.]|uniref:DUF2157 domain-containing protein n=1 Tax=Phenylobacterium sp. TaxID=1871053 RepID=UPI002FDF7CC5
MASYRSRLERDLDGWIGAGLVPADSREPILATVPEDRRLDAATALAAIGAFLAGAAVIAFVAANWAEIPRLVRFALILAAFLATAGGAAWAAGRGREVTKNVLLSVAALVFAAAIGLTGQIFDIAGDPVAALHGAGLAAGLLALAGRSSWAATAAVLFIVAGDIAGIGARLPAGDQPARDWALFAAPLAAAVALAWRSAPLAHATGLAALWGAQSIFPSLPGPAQGYALAASVLFSVAAAAARAVRERFDAATVLYGWLAAGMLIYFGASSFGPYRFSIVHPMAWLVLAGAVVALGRHDRHGAVTAVGVLGLFAAAARLLFDLGFGLLASAGVFAVCAVAALAIALVLRRRRAA